MTECLTAKAVHDLLTSPGEATKLQSLGSFNNIEDLQNELKTIGIDLSSCDPEQTLRVIREAIAELSDDELLSAQGGEVKFTALAVGVGAAAAVAGGIAVGGVAAGGVLLSKSV
jgi:hypothetical protein